MHENKIHTLLWIRHLDIRNLGDPSSRDCRSDPVIPCISITTMPPWRRKLLSEQTVSSLLGHCNELQALTLICGSLNWSVICCSQWLWLQSAKTEHLSQHVADSVFSQYNCNSFYGEDTDYDSYHLPQSVLDNIPFEQEQMIWSLSLPVLWGTIYFYGLMVNMCHRLLNFENIKIEIAFLTSIGNIWP